MSLIAVRCCMTSACLAVPSFLVLSFGDQSSMHHTDCGKLHWIADTSQGHAAPGVPQLERSAAWLPFWPIVPLVQPVQDS